ncbi:UPF0029-domain-containing protein [Lojkania enalia]|uniref:UPF0029-domain-containing protein n=1 Tax=Lojkania enalia TaxID=147567 RepID=A0A9P4K3H9_9PLEO|nr:UPF0029-domain-containing protein [Didymosphaeria enalia]
MTTNSSLADETTSINSIYDHDTLSLCSDSANIFSLRLPYLASITLRIEFPNEYPEKPPRILGTESVGEGIGKGIGQQVVGIVRRVLERVFREGEACIFDLLEESREEIEKAEEQGTLRIHDEHDNAPPQIAESASASSAAYEDVGPEPPWILAPPVTEKKSVFLARVAPATSPAVAKRYIRHLLATDKKVARATHNITAWRIRGANGASYQDCDDDGETAAGGRVLHLMQLMDVWDVMIVVTRWYGGVLLGPDRFRIINSAAREALVLGGWSEKGKDGGKEGGKKGKR